MSRAPISRRSLEVCAGKTPHSSDGLTGLTSVTTCQSDTYRSQHRCIDLLPVCSPRLSEGMTDPPPTVSLPAASTSASSCAHRGATKASTPREDGRDCAFPERVNVRDISLGGCRCGTKTGRSPWRLSSLGRPLSAGDEYRIIWSGSPSPSDVGTA